MEGGAIPALRELLIYGMIKWKIRSGEGIMRKKKARYLFFMLLFLLTACHKKTEPVQLLEENQFYLSAADGKKILIELPEEFFVQEEEKEVGVLKSYYNGYEMDLCELYYFKDTDEYGIPDIEEKMDTYVSEYQRLAEAAKGRVIEATEPVECRIGEFQGKYADVTYSLHNEKSYCAEFYLEQNGYILHGNLRLSKEHVGAITVEELIKKLGIEQKDS